MEMRVPTTWPHTLEHLLSELENDSFHIWLSRRKKLLAIRIQCTLLGWIPIVTHDGYVFHSLKNINIGKVNSYSGDSRLLDSLELCMHCVFTNKKNMVQTHNHMVINL